MAAPTKALLVDDCVLNGGVTEGKSSNDVETLKETSEPWVPTDSQIDHFREKTLMQKMEISINKLESSQIYESFRDKLQTNSISGHLHQVLGSESKMQMVIYGIGRLESDETCRLQLSFAILMKKDFEWIGDIEVFDPILSATECRILEALGCSVLSFNEHGRREALKPTMFFMPHCNVDLYNNLLQANWKPNLLSNIVIVGNSFEEYKELSEYSMDIILNHSKKRRSKSDWAKFNWDLMGHILAAQPFTNEFKIETNKVFDNLIWLDGLTWHFFSPVTETELHEFSMAHYCQNQTGPTNSTEKSVNRCSVRSKIMLGKPVKNPSKPENLGIQMFDLLPLEEWKRRKEEEEEIYRVFL